LKANEIKKMRLLNPLIAFPEKRQHGNAAPGLYTWRVYFFKQQLFCCQRDVPTARGPPGHGRI
jgi:hypothetical protein